MSTDQELLEVVGTKRAGYIVSFEPLAVGDNGVRCARIGVGPGDII
jgi:hypothetical protein